MEWNCINVLPDSIAFLSGLKWFLQCACYLLFFFFLSIQWLFSTFFLDWLNDFSFSLLAADDGDNCSIGYRLWKQVCSQYNMEYGEGKHSGWGEQCYKLQNRFLNAGFAVPLLHVSERLWLWWSNTENSRNVRQFNLFKYTLDIWKVSLDNSRWYRMNLHKPASPAM